MKIRKSSRQQPTLEGLLRALLAAGRSRPGDPCVGVEAIFPPTVIAGARSQGLVVTEAEGWRLTAAGAAWLRRRIAEGSGFQAQHQQRARRTVQLDNGTSQSVEVNDAESPLQWLNRRRDKDGQPMISTEQFVAGERLRADYSFAQLVPRVTSSWSPAGSSVRQGGAGSPADMRDNVIAARQRVNRAITAVGPEFAGILVDVCCHLQGLAETERVRGWPQRSGKLILQLALSCLARHYGIAIAAAAPRSTGSVVGHWGSGDYRPGFEERLERDGSS